MRRWLWFVLLCPVAAVAQSNGYTVDQLQAGLASYDRLEPEHTPAQADLMAGSYAVGYINAIANVGQTRAFCPTQSMDNRGLAHVVSAYIPTMAPWQHTEDASTAVIGALNRAFPCPPKAIASR